MILKRAVSRSKAAQLAELIVIFKNNKVLKITITTREGESKQTHSHRRDVTQNRIIFDDGYTSNLAIFWSHRIGDT
jgi:hypothetical protein